MYVRVCTLRPGQERAQTRYLALGVPTACVWSSACGPLLHRQWVVRADVLRPARTLRASRGCSCAAPLVLAACGTPTAGGFRYSDAPRQHSVVGQPARLLRHSCEVGARSYSIMYMLYLALSHYPLNKVTKKQSPRWLTYKDLSDPNGGRTRQGRAPSCLHPDHASA
jgi:hypothetical protein